MLFPYSCGSAALALLLCGAASAPAATLQFTLTNLAPADSFALDPTLFTGGVQDFTDVIFTPAAGGMEVLPQLGFLLTLDTAAAVLPPLAGGTGLPLLLPGDSLTFTLGGVDLLVENTLHFGAELFGTAVLADPAGQFTGLDLTLTAGTIARFESAGGGPPALVFPDSITPGPASVSGTTPVLRLTVVPEPASGGLMLAGLALALRRRRC